MNGEIFAKLEQKIQDAVDSIEMLKMENEELKAENARFQQEREEWEQRLGGLLDRRWPRRGGRGSRCPGRSRARIDLVEDGVDFRIILVERIGVSVRGLLHLHVSLMPVALLLLLRLFAERLCLLP